MKKAKKLWALLLMCSTLMSAIPIPAYAQDTDVKEQVESQVQVREPQDFTGNTEEYQINAYRIMYYNEDKEELVYADSDTNKIDVSQVPASQIRFDISLEFLCAKELWQMGENDTFSFTIPETYFTMENSLVPIPIYNSVKEEVTVSTDLQVAEYVVKDNTVTVTIHSNVQLESTQYVRASLQLPATIKTEALSQETITEAAIEGTQYSILLPKAAIEESQEIEQKEVEEKQLEQKEDAQKPEHNEGAQPEQEMEQDDTESSQEGSVGESPKDVQPKEQVAEKPEKEGILSKIRSSFTGFVNFFAGEEKGKEKAQKELITSHEFTKEQDNLPVGFNAIKLSAVSKEGGYKKGAANNKVRLDVSTFMDEDEFYLMSETLINNYADFPQGPEEDINQWIEEINKWRVKNPNIIPDYTFSYDLGEYFQGQADVTQDLILTRNAQNVNVGFYKIAEGVLTVSVHPICCFMDDVWFREGIEASLNEDKLSDEPIEVVMGDDGKLIFQLEGTAGGGSDEPEDIRYEVKKEGPDRVAGTSVEYQVEVKALQDEAMLNGKTLTDILPVGLEVTKATVVLNGTTTEEVKDESGKPSGSYTFKPYVESENNKITSAVFTFLMELTPEKYQDYIKNGIDTTFKNKAELSGADLGEKKVVSEEVSTKMSAKFINKSGKSDNIEGTRYAWNIQLNTKLSSMKDGYLVDTICDTDHQYDFAKGMEVQSEGRTVVIKDFVELPTDGTSWDDLTTETIKNLVPNSEFSENKAYYYTIDETDSEGNKVPNPFFGVGAEPEYKQRTILILPYKGLQGTNKSKAVTIRYATVLNMHGLGAEEYWNRINAGGVKPNINNKMNLLWDNVEGGVGPTPVSQDEVNFGKTVDTYPGAVVKKGANYNPPTQKLTWNVEVNKLGSDMKDVVLTDELVLTDYDISEELEIQWYNYLSAGGGLQESGVLPKGEDNADSKGRYYELVPQLDKILVKIHLGDVGPVAGSVGAYDFYKLQFSLKLKDSDILAIQNVNHIKRNTIKLDATVGGLPKSYEDTGEQLTPNVLMEKEAVGTYNYATYELPWKIMVNPNKLTIEGAIITDTILQDFVFDKVTKVEKNGVEDAAMLAAIKDENREGKTGSATFTLGNIQEMYTIYFTTKTTDKWRDDNLKSGDGTQTSIDVLNNAKLDGTIYGQDITASDDATHKIGKAPLGKSGKYNKEKGTITWTVDVNKEHFNVSGLKMVEELTKSGEKVIHELDPDSIKIWQVKVGADGKEILEEVSFTEGQLVHLGANGFTYVFPDISEDTSGKNYENYRFEFTTNLTEEAKGAAISNKIYLKDGSGNTMNESGTSDGGYGGDYEFDKDVHAQGRPRVILRKVSANSEDFTANEKNLGLDGAEFDLEVCEFDVDDGNNKLTITDSVIKYEKVRISKDGDAYFPNIKTSTQEVSDASNLICVLTEKSAAPGYVNNAEPHFIYFAPDTPGGNLIKENTATVAYKGHDYTPGTDAFYQYKIMETDGTTEGATVVMKNTPTSSAFTFNKQQINLASYKNINGIITSTDELAVGVEFEIAPLETAAEKLKSFRVTSDASGDVTIKDLDAGTYLLTETKPTAGHKPGTVKLQVTWNKSTNAYDYAFVPDSATGGIKITDGNLHNQLNTGKIEFTKYAKYEDGTGAQIVSGSENRQVLSGVKFVLKNSPGVPGPPKVEITSISGDDGKVLFDGLPLGTYDIYEVYGNDAVPGYKTNGTEEKVYQVEVTEDITQETRPVKVELTPERTDDSATYIQNTPIKGEIKFIKKSKDNQLSALGGKLLENAKFGLYRKIGTTTAKEPVYTATADGIGKVLFSNVEYGDYVLKETEAPAGYKPMSDVNITKTQIKDQVPLAPGETTFSYLAGDASNVILNETLKANVSLIKKDADKAGMAGVTFDIFRRGEKAIGRNGEDLELAVSESMKNFYQYGPISSVISQTDGTINLPNLPYGDYLLVEDTSGLDLQEGANKVVVMVCVDGGQTTSNVTVKVSGSDNANLVKDTINGGYTDVATEGFRAYTDEDADKIIVVNQKKYGYVNLNKAAGQKETSVDSTLIPYPSVEHPQYLKDATFEISRKKSDGSYERYLTLQTNAKGQFDISRAADTKGAYKDITSDTYKHLWYGEYKIKETTAPNGFENSTTEIVFTIGDTEDGGAGHEGTAWISFNGTEQTVGYVGKEEVPTNTLYLNSVNRGGFYITKIETGTTEKLSGAEFVVCLADGTEVAALKEHATEKGTYMLTNEKLGGGTYDKTNDMGIAYLHSVGGNQLLLAGKYFIKETKAPAGYKRLSDTKEVIVLTGQNTAEIQIENEPITMSVSKKSMDSTVTEELSGAEFVLKGNFADTTSTEKRLTDSNKSNISGLIVGEIYRLTEEKAPKGYNRHFGEVMFKIAPDGTIEDLQAAGAAENQITAVGTAITFRNVQNLLRLEKRAADILPGVTGDANLLDGATFTITNKGNAADTFEVIVTGGRVNIKGKLTGGATYILRETKSPEYYANNKKDIIFTMGEDGKMSSTNLTETENTITVYNEPIRLHFTKVGKYNESYAEVDADAVRPLEGVTFGVYAASDPDTQIETAVSDGKGEVIFSKLPEDTYIVRELSTVEGYQVNQSEYYAFIDDNGFDGLMVRNEDGTFISLKDNKVINDVFRADITFTKVSEKNTDKVLPGSEYGLYKEINTSGTGQLARSKISDQAEEKELVLVARAVTDKNGVLTFAGVLMNTQYVVKELRAPDGSYISKNPMKITFGTEVDEGGQVKIKVLNIDDGSGTIKVDPDTGEIIWLEPEVEVHFFKNTPDGAMLSGASLRVEDEEGNVIESWVSQNEAHIISGKLAIGQTYRLVETTAPTGYQIAQPIVFTIEDGEVGPNQKKIQEVIMVDEPEKEVLPDKPEVDKPTQEKPPAQEQWKDNNTVKTGDPNTAGIWIILLVAAVGFCGILFIKKRKNKK